MSDNLRVKVSDLQSDIHALLEDNAQDGEGEVSFRDEDTGEYDCDFELLMIEALHLASYETAWRGP